MVNFIFTKLNNIQINQDITHQLSTVYLFGNLALDEVEVKYNLGQNLCSELVDYTRSYLQTDRFGLNSA